MSSRLLGEMFHIGLCFTLFDIASDVLNKLFSKTHHSSNHNHHHHHKNDSNQLKENNV